MQNNLLTYKECREQIHSILCEFFETEMECNEDGEFDWEFLEFRTDDILRLIQQQGGRYKYE